VSSSGTRRAGLDRLALAAGVGLSGGLVGLIVPLAFVGLAEDQVVGFSGFGGEFFEVVSALVLAGAILLFLSFLLYRSAFWRLREEGAAFPLATTLCLVGSLGLLALLVVSIVVFGSSDTLAQCVQGRPTTVLTCLKASSPLGEYAALAGFWLGWVGGLGLVLGLGASGRRFGRPEFYGAAGLYAVLLLVLVGPFVSLLYTLPDTLDLLLTVPILLVLGPAFVVAATRRWTAPVP